MSEFNFPRVSDIGVMLDEVSVTDTDGDGTTISEQIQTRFYQDKSLTPSRWRALYLTGGGDSPTGTTVSYSTTSQDDPATALTTTHTLGDTRTRINIGKQANGMSFGITPSTTSSTTGFHLDSLEAEISPLYGRRR
jgi:hypothetical protein